MHVIVNQCLRLSKIYRTGVEENPSNKIRPPLYLKASLFSFFVKPRRSLLGIDQRRVDLGQANRMRTQNSERTIIGFYHVQAVVPLLARYQAFELPLQTQIVPTAVTASDPL